jgi:hypothetical protein
VAYIRAHIDQDSLKRVSSMESAGYHVQVWEGHGTRIRVEAFEGPEDTVGVEATRSSVSRAVQAVQKLLGLGYWWYTDPDGRNHIIKPDTPKMSGIPRTACGHEVRGGRMHGATHFRVDPCRKCCKAYGVLYAKPQVCSEQSEPQLLLCLAPAGQGA